MQLQEYPQSKCGRHSQFAIVMNPTPAKQNLQIRQGQLTGFHSFIFFLNLCSTGIFFNESGISDHIFGPKCDNDSDPHVTVLMLHVWKMFSHGQLMFCLVGTSIMQIRDLLVSAHAHYQDTCLSLNHAHHQTMSNTKTEKYENISSRDYVPRYLKISHAETMSRLMGREHPAPKPFMDASI